MPTPNRSLLLLLLVALPAAAEELSPSDLVKVAPEEGVPRVGPFKPTWCAAVDGKNAGPRALCRATDGRYLWDSFSQAAKFTCSAPDDPVFQEQLGYYMQRWANLTGASKEQLAELIALRVDDEKWEAQVKATCDKLPPADEEEGPRAKQLRQMERAVLGCNGRSVPQHLQGSALWGGEETWSFDRGAAVPSQLSALYRLMSCLPSSDEISMFELSRWAKCRRDLEQLDEAKLVAELAAAGQSDYGRLMALQALSSVRLEAGRANAKLTAAAAKDPEVKAVLVDAPARGWDAWVTAYEANKAAVDAAWAHEDLVNGPRLSAAKGCLPKASASLKLAHGKRPAATPEDLAASVTSGVGPILLDQLVTCLKAEGKTMPANALQGLVEWGMPGRGPRTAAQVAMAEAAAKVLADRPKFPVTADMVRVDGWAPDGATVGRGHRQLPYAQYAGVVKAVKKEGDRVTVTFQTVRWKEKERECVQTNRILQWRPDGTPLYAENCRYTGRIVEQSSTADPFYTLPALAAALKPGVFVTYNSGSERVGNVFEGVPVTVWSSKDKTSLLAVLGIEAR